MLMDYHALTMTESKNSPHRRAQFIVICSVIASCFVYSVIISGVLQTIQPYETPFPGGTFCYRQITRDYGASMGIGRRLQKEILEAFPEKDDEEEGITVKQRKKIIEDKVYHVYLDNPEVVGGSNMRWMSGILVSGDVEKLSYCDHLFDKNPGSIKLKKLNKDERYSEKAAVDLFNEALYQSVELPPVNSVAIKFPFSNGFSSALVFNYKIIPEMRQLAAKKGAEAPVVISQCSVDGGECTHYVPLVNGIDFHAGLPVTEEHQEANPENFDLLEAMKGGLCVLVPSLKPYLFSTSAASDDAEL